MASCSGHRGSGRDDEFLRPGDNNLNVTAANSTAGDVTADERQALPLAAEELATRLVSQLSEGW